MKNTQVSNQSKKKKKIIIDILSGNRNGDVTETALQPCDKNPIVFRTQCTSLFCMFINITLAQDMTRLPIKPISKFSRFII